MRAGTASGVAVRLPAPSVVPVLLLTVPSCLMSSACLLYTSRCV
ncbi:hypothetical protein [Arthrobacter sp. KBS0703]|nr:hypothetical protein [Arthrobacter sp. KBS0703]